MNYGLKITGKERVLNMGYKILMIAPTPFFADRGCHVRILEEITILEKMKHNVILCTYHLGRNLDNVNIRRTFNIPFYNKLDPGPSMHKLYLDLFLFFLTIKEIIQEKPNIIHGHLHEGAFIGFVVGKIFNIPLVFDAQGSLTDELISHNTLTKGSFIYKILNKIESYIYKYSNHIFVSSTNMAKYLINNFRIEKNKITVIEDGINTVTFCKQPFENIIKLKKELNIPLDKKVIVYLGTLNHFEGIEHLLKAIGKMVTKNPNIFFLIMGYPNIELYYEMSKRLEIENYVHFTGKLDYKNAPKYLSIGDISVSPKLSDTEANGKLINYMAMGLPVVAYDTPTNKEILGDLGIYASSKEPETLYQALNQALLLGENERLNLGAKLRLRVIEIFSWEDIVVKMIKIYDNLVIRG
ncbi:MAG: glycosyltransferase family 4 protein [Carboxydocellales bacterium]